MNLGWIIWWWELFLRTKKKQKNNLSKRLETTKTSGVIRGSTSHFMLVSTSSIVTWVQVGRLLGPPWLNIGVRAAANQTEIQDHVHVYDTQERGKEMSVKFWEKPPNSPLFRGVFFFFTRGKEKNKSLTKEAVNKELQLTRGHEGNKQEADLEPNRRACVMLGGEEVPHEDWVKREKGSGSEDPGKRKQGTLSFWTGKNSARTRG